MNTVIPFEHKIAAALSNWVYGDDHTIQVTIPGVVTSHCQRFENQETDTQGALVSFRSWDQPHLTLWFFVFRGTEIEARLGALRDIVSDVDVRPHPFLDGKAHAGFMAAAQSVLKFTGDLLPEDPFYVCGHSLGAAIAHYAALSMPQQILGCITFGEPALCDARLAKTSERILGQRHVRYTQTMDVVPHLPPSWRWRHAAKAVNIGSGGHSMPGYLTRILTY